MSLNDRIGAAMDSWIDRWDNLLLGCVLAFIALVIVVLVLGAALVILFPSHDDRTCVHRSPHLVGKVITYVCDEWGTASPTDPRP